MNEAPSFVTVQCRSCGKDSMSLPLADVTFWLDVYGRAAHQFICPFCEEQRVCEWNPTIDADAAVAFLEQAAGITVIRVGSLQANVDALAAHAALRAEPPSSKALWAQFDRLERRAQRRSAQA